LIDPEFEERQFLRRQVILAGRRHEGGLRAAGLEHEPALGRFAGDDRRPALAAADQPLHRAHIETILHDRAGMAHGALLGEQRSHFILERHRLATIEFHNGNRRAIVLLIVGENDGGETEDYYERTLHLPGMSGADCTVSVIGGAG
jgi:hypothetical protein